MKVDSAQEGPNSQEPKEHATSAAAPSILPETARRPRLAAQAVLPPHQRRLMPRRCLRLLDEGEKEEDEEEEEEEKEEEEEGRENRKERVRGRTKEKERKKERRRAMDEESLRKTRRKLVSQERRA